MNPRRIIIVGGGFAGVACANTLRRERSDPRLEIVLFSAENHLVFTPLLAEVVGAAINPLDVIVPLRQLLPGRPGRGQVEAIAVATSELRCAYLKLVGGRVVFTGGCGE